MSLISERIKEVKDELVVLRAQFSRREHSEEEVNDLTKLLLICNFKIKLLQTLAPQIDAIIDRIVEQDGVMAIPRIDLKKELTEGV